MRWAAVPAAVAAIGLGGAAHAQPAADSGKTGASYSQQGSKGVAKGGGENASNTTRALPGRDQELTAYERDSLAADRTANRIAETANTIGSDQRDYAFWQMILGVVGVGFTGIAAFFAYRATHWAKEAATQAGISAKADNEALADTRQAAEDARREAVAQAERFQRELGLAEEKLKIARRAAAEVDRAWLNIEVIPISGLRIDEEGASIEVRMCIENVGKGPAIGIESTADLTFNIRDTDQTIRQNAGLRILSGRFGDVMFPGKRDVWEGRVSVSREALDGAISERRASGDSIGIYPTVAMGLRYSLPGDDERRLTYTYLVIARKKGGEMRFDNGATSIGLADLTWSPHVLTGPVS